MRNLLLLFCVVCLFSCSKEKFGPLNLTDGQIVELLVSDKFNSESDYLLKLPSKERAGAGLSNFTARKPGYIYKIKAKFVKEDEGLQDAPAYYFRFQSIISEEKYLGTESFIIPLIENPGFGSPTTRVEKIGDKYIYTSINVELTFANEDVKNKLEEIWQDAKKIKNAFPSNRLPKWRAIRATAKHDPAKFGSAYLIEKIEFLN